MGYNRGEWTELYVLMKLLADRKLQVCDSDLEKIEDVYYPIIKIFKDSIYDNELEFSVEDTIKITLNDKKKIEIEIIEFIKNAEKILNAIKEYRGKRGAFEIKGIEEMLDKINIKVKQSSTDKDDLKVQVEDKYTNKKPILTFSIKSKLGAGATILNASSATNIKYKISKLDTNYISSVNSINTRTKLIDRYKKIIELGGKIEFDSYEEEQFFLNLRYIDGDAPIIIAYLVLYSYEYNTKYILKLIEHLNTENPLNINLNEYKDFYKSKIIKVIRASAFGMMPSKPWDGNESVTGGIIVTKENGEIVLLDKIYYENELNEYLINNTKLESPSSTRYNMLELKEEENNMISFTLNLQIRFK